MPGRALFWGPTVSPTQTPTFWIAGESCQAQGTVLTHDCANQCPRSCADLWDHVQCLQGPCRPGNWPHDSLARGERLWRPGFISTLAARGTHPARLARVPNLVSSPHPRPQAAAVPLDSWYKMVAVCPSPPAAVASPVPMPHGSWPQARWCSWTATTGMLLWRQPGPGTTGGSGWWAPWVPWFWVLDSAPEAWLHALVHSTCVNGSLACPHLECPLLGPWSAWSRCSATCGGGISERRRSCKGHPGTAPCQAQDMEQQQECNLQRCPGVCSGPGSGESYLSLHCRWNQALPQLWAPCVGRGGSLFLQLPPH